MHGDTKRIRRSAAIVGKEMKDKTSTKMKEMAGGMMQKGALPKDMLGISDGTIEAIYGQAYRLYNTGKYKDACQLFRLLVMLHASEPKYCMGMAACFHMLKDYKGAVEAYAVCSLIDPESPIPHFHSSDCYLQMKNPISALVALEMAVKRAGDRPHYAVLKDRAMLTVASLKKEIIEAATKE